MDKISKFLLKLTPKEREVILQILLQIQNGDGNNLDSKKLVGENNLYRIRKGNIRIVYSIINQKGIIKNIDYRGNIY